MKKALSLALLAVFALTACESLPIRPDDVTAYIQSHSKMLTDGIASVTKFALSLAEKDPVKRQELKDDINVVVEKVSRGLDAAAATAGGTLTPDQLAEDLKVRDESVQAFFDGLVVLYREGYDKLVASGKATETIAWSKMILNGLKVMSDGLNKATK